MHERDNGLRTLSDYAPSERVALLRRLRKVVFVRDPWSRLLSAYLNKFVQEPEPRRRMWLNTLLKPLRAARPSSVLLKALDADATLGSALSFEAFVAILEEVQRAVAAAEGRQQHDRRQPPVEGRAAASRGRAAIPAVNEHWAPQSELCGLHALRFDFVGYHADIARDAQGLEAFIGFSATPPTGTQYGWEGNRNSSRLLRQYYTRSLVQRVGRLFKSDLSVPLNGVTFSAKDVLG